MGRKRSSASYANDEVCPMDIDEVVTEPVAKRKRSAATGRKKKHIPVALKRQSWYNLYTKQVGQTKCPICNAVDITQLDFECAHIISEYNDGPTAVNNLMPLCNHCNKSMSKRNILDYAKEFYPSNIQIYHIVHHVQSIK